MNAFDALPQAAACGPLPMRQDTAAEWPEVATSWRERRLLLISGPKAPSAPLRELLESGLDYGVSVAQGEEGGLILAKRPGFDLILLTLTP